MTTERSLSYAPSGRQIMSAAGNSGLAKECPLHGQFEKRLDERWKILDQHREDVWDEQRKMNHKAFECMDNLKKEMQELRYLLVKIAAGLAAFQTVLQYAPKFWGK